MSLGRVSTSSTTSTSGWSSATSMDSASVTKYGDA